MNRSSKKEDLVSSALRIYLAHTLNQTEDVIRATNKKVSSSTGFFRNDTISDDSHPHEWVIVLVQADRVVSFIKECQKALETSDGLAVCVFNNLCIIEACQDSLKEALLSSRCYSPERYKLHVALSEKHACKATYLTYAFVAADRDGDRPLSRLWLLAVRSLSEAIELQLNIQPSPTPTTKECLEKAEYIRVKIEKDKHTWSAECLRLHNRSLRHTCYAAAMSALFQYNMHESAAEIYENAADVRNLLDRATNPAELALLEQVAAKYQLAMEMVAAQAGKEFNILNFGEVHKITDSAFCLLSCIHQVRKLGAAMDELKAEHATSLAAESKCRDATMLRVWQVLRTEQESVLSRHEQDLQQILVDGVVTTLPLLGTETEVVKRLATTTSTVREIHACRDRVAMFKQEAAQALQGARPSKLAHKCWMKAAECMEAAAQVCIDFVLEKTLPGRALNNVPDWRLQCEHTQRLLCIVESVLPQAEEYRDKARGAEAREAQMWRKAAEFRMKEAEMLFKDVGGATATHLMGEQAEREALAAEYFLLAFKHRTLPNADTRQNGTRVAVLYERAAEILYDRSGSWSPNPHIDNVLSFHAKAFDRFNDSSHVSAEELTQWERGCEYGKMACDTSIENEVVALHWGQAFHLTENIIKLCATNTKARDVTILKARVALHVCAAQTTVPQVLHGYEACLAVLAEITSSPTARGYNGLPNRQYQLALVTQIVHLQRTALGPKTFVVPPGLQSALGRAARKEQRLPLLQDHAQVLLLQYRCIRVPCYLENMDRWDEALTKVNKLCEQYSLCSVEMVSDPEILFRLAFRKSVVRCYVGAAESFVLHPVSANDFPTLSEAKKTTATAWDEAVAMCRKANVRKTTSESDIQLASIAVERYIWVAEQAKLAEEVVRQAMEKKVLSEMSLQVSEMEIFRELLRKVALAAGEVYRQPSDPHLVDAFAQVEARAKAAAELRRSRGDKVTAYPT